MSWYVNLEAVEHCGISQSRYSSVSLSVKWAGNALHQELIMKMNEIAYN